MIIDKKVSNTILHIAKEYNFYYKEILAHFMLNQHEPFLQVYTIGDNDVIKGFIIYEERERGVGIIKAYERQLLFMFVCPEYRNQKIGTLLLKEFEREEDSTKFIVYCVQYEHNVLEFYKKHNYNCSKKINKEYDNIFKLIEPKNGGFPRLYKVSNTFNHLIKLMKLFQTSQTKTYTSMVS